MVTRAPSTTGGYPLEGYSPEVPVPSGAQIVDSPEAARQAVREQIKYGADLIRIYSTHRFRFTPDGKLAAIPTFTLEEVKASVDEAHREGVKVACHAYGGEGLHNCVDGGVDSIEHGLLLDDSAVEKASTSCRRVMSTSSSRKKTWRLQAARPAGRVSTRPASGWRLLAA